MGQETLEFSFETEQEREVRKTLIVVYNALREKGYDPVNQIIGYVLSGDPTYITTHHNARTLIRHLDGYDILHVLLKNFFKE